MLELHSRGDYVFAFAAGRNLADVCIRKNLEVWSVQRRNEVGLPMCICLTVDKVGSVRTILASARWCVLGSIFETFFQVPESEPSSYFSSFRAAVIDLEAERSQLWSVLPHRSFLDSEILDERRI